MVDYSKLDPGVRDMVRYFNEQGLTTYMSCEGHFPAQPCMALFWISFDPAIKQEDIENFMRRHKDKQTNCFVSAGHFVKRFYVGVNETTEEYMYEVGCKEAADLDLRAWREADRYREIQE